TRTVADNALVLQSIVGVDANDSTSAPVEVPDFSAGLTGDIKGLRIGIPTEYMGEGVDPRVKEVVQQAIAQFEALGATVHEVSLPHSEYGIATYYLLASSEASANLARFDGVRYGHRAENPQNLMDLYKRSRSEGFGEEVKRRIMLGTFALSSGYYDAYYKKAQQVRTLIKNDFHKAFETVDVIVGPTAPTTAFKIGENTKDPLTMYANDILTIPVNLAGAPAISVPCGFVDGLPVGLQIIGRHFDEVTVYRAAHAYEQATNWHTHKPTL
ncbi:MAG: amidase family protein, partial [Bacilli bacterium]